MGFGSLAPLASKRVVVLPDAYIDALVRLPRWDRVLPQMERIVRNGGGNLPVGPVEFKLGGNAANFGVALSRLGAKVDLITQTDELGQFLLRRAARHSGINIRSVEVGKKASATLALEFEDANLMLSHAGPLYEFGPGRLSEEHWALMEGADAVVMVNWAQNQKGTRLMAALAPRLKAHDVFLYTDTSDPRHRGDAVAHLLAERRIWQNVDAWSLNENEVRAFCGDAHGAPEALGRALSKRIKGRLDLHTRRWAASIQAGESVRVAARPGKARRLTGAGDTWNAGNLAGYLLDWPTERRLAFAHKVAAMYVTGPRSLPPTADQAG
jgi:ribokinase